ncbi:ribosome hibernation-promoting factor, HPF/YfiA family [Flavobacterium luminosum]|uniref:Ribosome-associated translation inhibitor RaiA n=1 Tax=Flavobacterium luminosum TaxID=2949086 RepID=A0ABT0TKA2_9FLAO|nr:ribosome-associated translation inhibitor RaiA [Flavobacterium sp. HXWNR70]MCL9807892.1 ribosome-associated translation inhibitor RaiA [Flavobacterium sp. HXWNR70]
MKVNVHAVNFNIDRKLVDFIDEKVNKLEKFYDRIVSADAFLKVEQTSEKENKVVELKVIVPGDEFIVKKTCKTFEEGVDLSVEAQQRLLLKRKEKLSEHA